MDSNIVLPTFQETLRLHVDTEFTDFVNCDLISIGIASDLGPTFYGENKDFRQDWSSKFVIQEIYPLLDIIKFGHSRYELAARIWMWIDELPCNKVIVTVDYPTDWILLYQLFGSQKHPKMLDPENVFQNFSKWARFNVMAAGSFHEHDFVSMYNRLNALYFEGYKDHFKDPTQIRHHALSDAKANRAGYSLVVREFGMPT